MSTTESQSHNVSTTLYVVADCPLCARMREELTRRGIAYLERDVRRDFAALRRMYRLTRQKFVPVIERNGIALVRPTASELDSFIAESL